MNGIRGYECSLDGDHWQSYNALSRGKAKMMFYYDLDCEIDYIEIKCRVIGDVQFFTSEGFIRNAKYRGIEFAYCGMKVTLGENKGVIVGHNSSANLDVLFYEGEYKARTLNCHPNWKLKYFDKNGKLIRDYDSNPVIQSKFN